MKKFLHFLFAGVLLVSSASAFGQLPDGATAPEFSGTDINGNTWTLSEILAEGKTVIMDVSATWCGPCWSYHNSKALSYVHECLGPDGADEVVVLFIEGDGSTTQADLEGTGGATTGDWITGTPYPIIDDASIADLYEIAYFPTIYKICPDGLVYEIGQQGPAGLTTESLSGCDNAIDGAQTCYAANAGAEFVCGEASLAMSVTNVGSIAMTSATVEVYIDGNLENTVDFNGTIDGGATGTIDLGTTTTAGSIEAVITMINGEAANNAVEWMLNEAPESTTHIQVSITPDNYDEETSWRIEDENGTVIAEVAQGALDGQAYNTIVEDVFAPSTGCYRFILGDSYGDGLHGEAWGVANGSCTVTTLENGSVVSTIYTDNGYNWGNAQTYTERQGVGNINMVVGVENNELVSSLNVFPNPTNGLANVVLGTTGSADVTIEVVNILGGVVLRQDLGTLPAGEQRTQLDLNNVEAGMYLVNITANNNVSTVRLNLTK